MAGRRVGCGQGRGSLDGIMVIYYTIFVGQRERKVQIQTKRERKIQIQIQTKGERKIQIDKDRKLQIDKD